jgi:hypothetical protein
MNGCIKDKRRGVTLLFSLPAAWWLLVAAHGFGYRNRPPVPWGLWREGQHERNLNNTHVMMFMLEPGDNQLRAALDANGEVLCSTVLCCAELPRLCSTCAFIGSSCSWILVTSSADSLLDS